MPESNLEDYYKYELGEIIIFIIRSIKVENNEISIGLSKLFKWKKLTIEGVLVKK